MRLQHLRTTLFPLALSLPLVALANSTFSNLFVFGDSLSDTGNLASSYALLAGLPAPTLPPQPPGSGFNGPYYQNSRPSNGPVWIEHLAVGLGLATAAAPALLGGNNYAFASARTGLNWPTPPGDIPGVATQALALWGGSTPIADPNALYVVVGGGNDMRDARAQFTGMSPVDVAGHGAAAIAAINNLALTLTYLAARGARNVMISTLPDIGQAPEAALLSAAFNLPDLQAASSDAADQFNALIASTLMGLGTGLGLHMTLLDMAGLTDDILAHPASFGITNTLSPCAGFEYSSGASCDTSLFSDVLHPSAYTHSLIALEALAVLGVPEPDALALFGLAMLVLLTVQRRRSLAVRCKALHIQTSAPSWWKRPPTSHATTGLISRG